MRARAERADNGNVPYLRGEIGGANVTGPKRKPRNGLSTYSSYFPAIGNSGSAS